MSTSGTAKKAATKEPIATDFALGARRKQIMAIKNAAATNTKISIQLILPDEMATWGAVGIMTSSKSFNAVGQSSVTCLRDKSGDVGPKGSTVGPRRISRQSPSRPKAWGRTVP